MKPKLKKIFLYVSSIAFTSLFWFVVLQAIFEGYSKSWTGFGDYTSPNGDFVRGKTLWDWMALCIVPFFLGVGVFMLNYFASEREKYRERQQSILEQNLATDRQQEAALQSYLDRMADLLLKDNLRTAKSKEVRNVARVRTLTVLRGLDAKRKGIVLLFLYESGLIREKPIVDLNGADLSGADLFGAMLSGANLGEANLKKANLKLAKLDSANLERSNLREANLDGAHLDSANLEAANLYEADLSSTSLVRANLTRAELVRAKLRPSRRIDINNPSGADLTEANLSGAILYSADLSNARLGGANLRGAVLRRADLSNANLLRLSWLPSYPNQAADLSGADLTSANMSGAEVANEQLASARSLQGATLPDGTKHD